MIGRIYCTNCGDIVLDSERSVPGSLCVSSRENHGSEDSDQWDLGRKDDGSNQTSGSVCRTEFEEYGELVVCEELSRFLQKTYYRRLTAYGIWKKIASQLAKSAAGKKSKAVIGYGRARRSTARSRSPTGHELLACLFLLTRTRTVDQTTFDSVQLITMMNTIEKAKCQTKIKEWVSMSRRF